MAGVINIHEILKLLPHRYPFVMVDRVLEIKPGESIVALKNVTMNEPYFMGHFPGRPVMPGVMILEAMAQAGAVLAYQTIHSNAADGMLYFFAGINNARFRRVVEPGDQLRLEVKFLKAKLDIWKLSGMAYVGDELACSSEFTSARRAANEGI